MTQSADLILTNGIVLTMNGAFDCFSPGAVAIQDDSILAVGPAEQVRQEFGAPEIVDCAGQAIIPGLINGHTHAPMSLLRGLADDLRLDVWLLGYMMPVEREFVRPEFVRLGTRLACAEMIRSGVTCFADMYYYEQYVATAAAEAGLRAVCAETVLKFPTPDAYSYEESLRRCHEFIDHWQGHTLVTPAVGPHAHYTCTADLLQSCAQLAREHDVPLLTHISETMQEVETSLREHGMPVVPWLQRNGILDTKLTAAHCVHIGEDEMQMLLTAGAGVIHNPTSNLKLASGIAPVTLMLRTGLKVGVGTDGPASNNDLDLLDEARLAAFLAKGSSGDPTALPARQAFALATIEGARALHLDHLTGSLEPGKQADVAVIDLSGLHTTPKFGRDPDAVYAQLIYSAKGSDTVHTLVAGRWLMRDRALLTLNEEEISAEAAEVAAQIDAFLIQREQSVLSKLLVIGGVRQEESFEVQVRSRLGEDGLAQIEGALNDPAITITKRSRYRQYDTYFIFDHSDPDAELLRFREDQILALDGGLIDARNRITLIGTASEREFPGAVMLSRSRYISPADKSRRFYEEYFQPVAKRQVEKVRDRWRILYKNTDFAVNVDRLILPAAPGRFLEIKSRTWSIRDAERKAALIVELMELFGAAKTAETIRDGYVDWA
jgi:5-methylthioadenosine/S-adenosylhomocysteine deaminase